MCVKRRDWVSRAHDGKSWRSLRWLDQTGSSPRGHANRVGGLLRASVSRGQGQLLAELEIGGLQVSSSELGFRPRRRPAFLGALVGYDGPKGEGEGLLALRCQLLVHVCIPWVCLSWTKSTHRSIGCIHTHANTGNTHGAGHPPPSLVFVLLCLDHRPAPLLSLRSLHPK